MISLASCLFTYIDVEILSAGSDAIPDTPFVQEYRDAFMALGLYPTLAILVVVQVLYRAGRYGMTKPAREMLWTVLGRTEKYKAKPFLDAAVYRGGDLVSGWIYTGLAALGLSIGAIALVAAPVAGIWAVLGIRLGRREEALASQQGETT